MNRTEYKDLPKIAIIGRPAVGKSSIFNRMLKRRKAIVESTPGVTRDRLYAHIRPEATRPSDNSGSDEQGRQGEADFILIDTGGIVPEPKERIAHLVHKQSKEAIDESDAVIFACDVSSGITFQDEHIATLLRKTGKRVFLVVNKIDSFKHKNDVFEFYKLGLGRPYGVSALHNKGFDELHQDIAGHIEGIKKNRAKTDASATLKGPQPASSAEIKIAVVGRPNVGKSSFVNCLIDQERMLVDETPGTTRDSVDIRIKRGNRPLTIVDTAGIRHKKKIREAVDIFSMARAKQSIRRCDVALVMIDATAGLCRDDIAIIDYVIKQGRCCVLLVNKWDLVEGVGAEDYKKALCFRFKPLEWIPVKFTSCKERRNIIKAIDTASEVAERSRLSLPTPQLNELFEESQRTMAHPSRGKARPRIYYAAQLEISPPKILLFVTNPRHIKKEYLRFIERRFRRRFNLDGVPIVFQLRAKK